MSFLLNVTFFYIKNRVKKDNKINWNKKVKEKMKTLFFVLIIASVIVSSVKSRSTKLESKIASSKRAKIYCSSGTYQHIIVNGDNCYNMGSIYSIIIIIKLNF